MFYLLKKVLPFQDVTVMMTNDGPLYSTKIYIKDWLAVYHMHVYNTNSRPPRLSVLVDCNNNQDTDIVDLSTVEMVLRIPTLVLFGKRAIATGIEAGEFGFADEGGG